jgi:hypothetical protein
MIEILDYATKYPKPKSWHNIGRDEASRKAVECLEAAGLVEVAEHSQQYRLTPWDSTPRAGQFGTTETAWSADIDDLAKSACS